jgi:hypothetical protein
MEFNTNQRAVNDLRIDLALVKIDLSEVFVHDDNSRQKKEKVYARIRHIDRLLDHMGLVHSQQR